MFNTAFTFGLTQFARSLSLPERLQKRPLRNATLEPWRFRNSSLDAMFYDIKMLTADEAFYISDSLAAEGMVMIVPPTGQGMLTLCDSVDEYILRGGRDVHVMAVAGIGGSAAGAAAFARNVADAVGAPVAAVVSGYGLGDILSEAMGGNFFFGPLGFLRHNFELIDDLVGRPKLGDYTRRGGDIKTARPVSLDTDTVEALLTHDQLHFNLVTGHSKGNLIIAEALYSIEETAPKQLEAIANDLQLISFAARIAVPATVAPALSIMGELDWYGELNATAPAAGTIRVARSGHSTNSDMPGALKITNLLRDALSNLPKQQETTAPEPEPEAVVAEPPPPEKAPVLKLVTPVEDTAAEEQEQPLDIADTAIAEVEQPILQATPAVEEPNLEELVPPPAAAEELAPEPDTAPEAAAAAIATDHDTISMPVAPVSEPTPDPVPAPKAKTQTRPTPRRNRKK
ncbi:cell envelope biogenesis protein OmpA [Rhizobium sp.]|jgi:hypothetical protein|uniref:cell envelope biogenesis protein OmpA n=1 Tax=Rhizobium sp. TaxID=391 RepID=UPI000E87C326|nr:cell envelope biogenesis protein OmpA [Rhizobium sp.]